ncbi:MAG: hydroxymethylbilane synthase [Betaproteobacteria bacterium TMED41]|nr:MAG: hydroxymethylbilane synthase [Betaproteobacteria bacterium TMED41]|tara:strand:+ start:750 stop:1658 length:909 start_codon:yes stop_codon:yes gene_type:complete
MWIIASRESRLALWQAKFVQKVIKNYSGQPVEILGITTKGDKILDQSLSKIGGKGLFVKELETALLKKNAHLAVHSLKDVPMDLPDKFFLGAVLKREDPRDAFVSNKFNSLEELPNGALVGTSSLRREFQLRRNWPNLRIVPLRGNLDTRLKKLDDGNLHGIILAAAGLKRLNLTSRIKQILNPEVILPATGQGALGIEVLKDNNEVIKLIQPMVDLTTTKEVTVERIVSRNLGASCQLPLAVFCEFKRETQNFRLRAKLAMPDGSCFCSVDLSGSEEEKLGNEAAKSLIDQGAKKVINNLN